MPAPLGPNQEAQKLRLEASKLKSDLSQSMPDILKNLNSTNSTLDSVPRRRVLARINSCRGVPGLPQSEDYQLPKNVRGNEGRVQELLVRSQNQKKPLKKDPGNRDFEEGSKVPYLKPKTLNSWQTSRALMPPRSYKAWIRLQSDKDPETGQFKNDLRELYRFRAWNDEPLPVPDPSKMGEQHIKWMIDHEEQREEHLYPIYYYRYQCKLYEQEKERRLLLRAEEEEARKDLKAEEEGRKDGEGEESGTTSGGTKAVDAFDPAKPNGIVNTLVGSGSANNLNTDRNSISGQSASSSSGTGSNTNFNQTDGLKALASGSLTKSLPALRKPKDPTLNPKFQGIKPINIYPPKFDYINRNGRLFMLNNPWQDVEDTECTMKTYVPKEKIRRRDWAKKEEEKRIMEEKERKKKLKG